MKVRLYAVLDTASAVYDGPVPAQTDEVAIRNFSNMALQDNNAIGKNPEFFSLWVVGEWDDALGAVVPLDKKVLVNAIDIRTNSYNEDE